MPSLTDIRPFEISTNTSFKEIDRLFALQQNHISHSIKTTVGERIKKLKKLREVLIAHRTDIQRAMFEDYHKPAAEVDLAEILPLLNELKYTIRKLRSWTSDHRVGTPWFLLGGNSYIHYEPKGHCLVIAPWNFPIHLTVMPLLHAYAAGNVTMIKPSEFTPFSNAIIKKIVNEVFREEEATLVEGDGSVSAYLTSLRFNHIFFTGSPKIGRMVMKAAADNLASVTLELGGKSPMIIDETADLDLAAIFTAVIKLTNAGQICISPDHIYVHESVKDSFTAKLLTQIKARFGEDVRSLSNADYCHIINKRQALRLKSLLDDALVKGANIVFRAGEDEKELIGPIILTDVSDDMKIVQDEIFGPLTYIRTFNQIDEVINNVTKGEKPLSLYLFTKNGNTKRRVTREISAGNMCINSAALNYYNYNLPFGGVNNSGIGKSHGFHSFQEFSNAKAVFNQWSPRPGILLMFPPFTKRTRQLIDLFLKFF